MAIISYLQGLGATHLFTLNNEGTLTTDDKGDSVDPTNISGGTYTFQTDPVCEGVTHSLETAASTTNSTDGGVFDNRADINNGQTGGNGTSSFDYNNGVRSLMLWFKQDFIENATCIYEQGGGVNNFAFMGGALTTFQAADSGQPFLILQSLSLAQANRPYFLVGVWEHHSNHAGSGNRILFYINGVLQGIRELTGTDSFPGHSGDITIGNSSESLQSFTGTTLQSQTTAKNCNYLGMFNNVSLTQAQSREIFERTVFADVTIAADTVANQQAALDALIGNTYENTNCAIRIIQATDATNYRLFIDDITFNADDNLEDISIQFVGTGTLTVEDTNGTVIKYTSTPGEVETTTATYTGGGSIVVVNNTKRVTADQTIVNPQDDKIVFDGSGTVYTIDGGIVPVIENVSGNTVTVNLLNGTPTPTLLETDGSFIIVDAGIINVTNGTTYTVDAEKKFVVDTDTVTSFTIDGFIPTEIETTGTGSTTIIGINNAKLTTTNITGTGTLVRGDGLNPSANWSVSSNVLTLSGTEGDLLGLRGLAEVDYADAGGKIVYTVNESTRIVISSTGDLTIDSDVEQLICGVTPASNVNTLIVDGGGRLQLGKAKVVGGFTIYSSGPGLVFSNDSPSANFTVADAWANLKLENNSRLDWYGGEIQSVGLILPRPGSEFRTYSKEAMFVSVPSKLQSSRPEAYIRMQTSDQIIDGFVNKFGILLMIGKPTSFSGYEPISSGSAIDMSNQSTASSFYDFSDLIAGKGNTRDVGGKSNTWVRLLNTNLGSNITVTAQSTSSSSQQTYLVESRKGLIFNYEDETGTAIQNAKLHMVDTDNGSRLAANQVGTNVSYTSDRVYTGVSSALGVIDLSSVANSVLLSVHYSTNPSGNPVYSLVDYRGNANNSTDIFTFNSVSYNHDIGSTNIELKGVSTLNQEQVLITDLVLTETNKTTVDAYTELGTAQKVYDAFKSEFYDNYAGETSLILGRQGNQVDLDQSATSLVIDATASSVRDLTGTVATIKASTYTGGALSTGSRSVTTTNGALLNGGTFDCDVNYQSGAGTTLTNVTVTSGNSIDFNTAGTYTIDGGSLNEVTNSSGGSITLTLINGASVSTNTGPNITVNNQKDISITNITAGSRIQIYNTTTSTEVYNNVVAGTSYVATYNEGGDFSSGDNVRIRFAYVSGVTAKNCLEVNTIAGASGWSVLANQTDDSVYIANAIDGSTVTEYSADYPNVEIDVSDADGETTIQRLYAWFKYNEFTSQGIANLFCAILPDDAFNYVVVTSVLDLKLNNTSSSPVKISGAYIRRDDDDTVIAAASNSIQLDPSKAYIARDFDAIGNAVWQKPVVGETNPNGSAGEVLENLPKVIALKQDL